MTARYDFDRQVASWLESERPSVAPAHLLEAVRDGVAGTGRRPGWQVADRWTWRHAAAIARTVRVAIVVAVLASLLAILIVVAGLLGAPRPAPPFGLATPGRIAMDTADGIVLTNSDGSDRVVVVPADGKSISPTWSRDGLHLAFWHRASDSGPWALTVVDAKGGNRAILADGITLKVREESVNQPSNLSWSPDSRRIAFAADDAGGSSIFIATLGRVGAARITEPDLLAIDPAWSPTGDVIAFAGGSPSTLHVVHPDGSGEHRLGDLGEAVFWPDWSPDGSRVAIAAVTEDDDVDIYVVSADGAKTEDVSKYPGFETSPTWSPDGTRLAWARAPEDEGTRAWVVVADVDGSKVVEIRTEADFAPPTWSPDGRQLFTYAMAPDGTFEAVLVLDPAGDAPVIRLPAAGNTGNSNWQRLP